jgi:1,2-diacylglycerol 3-alpha-glucosyltransferase
MRIKLKLPPEAPVILHVGQLHTAKQVGIVILAAGQVMHQTNAHLVIVGDGPQKPALMKMCKTLGIEDRSHFIGYLSLEEGLPVIYRLASLFVTASEIETQGLVLLEAAASGLPIVATRSTCIPEIVDDQINGFLSEPGDVFAMAASIAALLSDPMKAKKMGKASRELVREHDIRFTLDKHEQLYEQLIKQAHVEVEAERTNVSGRMKELDRVSKS